MRVGIKMRLLNINVVEVNQKKKIQSVLKEEKKLVKNII
jgi:hypothetical protein